MNDELHAARFVEEAFERDDLLRRQDAERRETGRQVAGDLLGRRRSDADLGHEPASQHAARRIGAHPRLGFHAQARDGARQRVGPARRLAEPERQVRRLTLGVLDPHGPALDPQDAVGGVAELEHIADRLSTAKSSLTLPMTWFSGSSST